MDLSVRGIKFACNRRSYQCPQSLAINNVTDLRIQFDDGEILSIKVKILRCFEDVELEKTCFAGSIITGMPEQRISKEQEYVRRCFSDFHTL